MDIWEQLYQAAKPLYHPEDVNQFIYAHNVVCALQSRSGQIYTGFCVESACGALNLCAERVALLDMFTHGGETQVQRIISFRDAAPSGVGGMPCGVCREALLEFNPANRNTQIMVDYATRQTITLDELMPNWWGPAKARTTTD
ncbi:cytidine deaminase family protein [Levilactobacillus acidifarinae]|uniref:Cytidine deaminase n=1 Tax=Levilactobacillus acidifarinae DSM 19394 = JCM 15949 TaxID=1423715 RepID=A0A0R1LGB3_9LACO|nr:cytidine deaminase [Levilactobacillus acidifarinae]KRK94528.1 cytidine deaminase [Levilactobacillus acidifarinae DSM 19394]GEO68277.1 cytidine deaminase [Levilactobacillus acidifarinae]